MVVGAAWRQRERRRRGWPWRELGRLPPAGPLLQSYSSHQLGLQSAQAAPDDTRPALWLLDRLAAGAQRPNLFHQRSFTVWGEPLPLKAPVLPCEPQMRGSWWPCSPSPLLDADHSWQNVHAPVRGCRTPGCRPCKAQSARCLLRVACRCTRGLQSIASTLHRTGEAGSLRPRSSRLYAPLGLAGGLQAGMDRGRKTSRSSCCAAAACCSSRHWRHTAVRLAAKWGGKVRRERMVGSAWHLCPCRNLPLCLQALAGLCEPAAQPGAPCSAG